MNWLKTCHKIILHFNFYLKMTLRRLGGQILRQCLWTGPRLSKIRNYSMQKILIDYSNVQQQKNTKNQSTTHYTWTFDIAKMQLFIEILCTCSLKNVMNTNVSCNSWGLHNRINTIWPMQCHSLSNVTGVGTGVNVTTSLLSWVEWWMR